MDSQRSRAQIPDTEQEPGAGVRDRLGIVNPAAPYLALEAGKSNRSPERGNVPRASGEFSFVRHLKASP